jgi:hypothetical protein
MMIVMKRSYCSPVAESISVETFVLAASTGATRSVPENEVARTEKSLGDWGNIWYE